jgi:hypothetical protein
MKELSFIGEGAISRGHYTFSSVRAGGRESAPNVEEDLSQNVPRKSTVQPTVVRERSSNVGKNGGPSTASSGGKIGLLVPRKREGGRMALTKRGRTWHTHFFIDGQRFRQSLGTTDWRDAQAREKELVALASARGSSPRRASNFRSLR